MSIRQLLTISILSFQSLMVYAQSSSGQSIYCPKDGDKVVKKEIQYVHPEESGENRLWDFCSVSSKGEELIEGYEMSKDSTTIIRTAPGHRICYNICSDTVFCTGFVNSNTSINYLRPEVFQVLPSAYGDSVVSLLYGEGKYSETLNICTYGKTSYKIDSYGTLILPGDTVRYNSFRTKHHTRVGQKVSPHTSILSNGCTDSYSDDSIRYKLDNDSIIWCIDRYNWFVPGYRFPAIETINTYILSNGIKIAHDNVSYYYPLEEQENYFISESYDTDTFDKVSSRKGEYKYSNFNYQEDICLDKFVYNYHISDDNCLKIELRSRLQCNTTAVLTNVAGMLIDRQEQTIPEGGCAYFSLHTRDLVAGVYILTLYSGNNIICEKIHLKGNNYE
ncbi:MAG: hypothetical protein IJY78_04310 [Bacteroidaceae bacterium]|nr:hypothetical protein [Bacteroidaceae bacterium]